MIDRLALQDWIVESLEAQGGSARVVEVCKHIWNRHESDLRAAGDFFYIWQYEVRWAAKMLRDAGRLDTPSSKQRRGLWTLKALP